MGTTKPKIEDFINKAQACYALRQGRKAIFSSKAHLTGNLSVI
jgi:hypothetical protein